MRGLLGIICCLLLGYIQSKDLLNETEGSICCGETKSYSIGIQNSNIHYHSWKFINRNENESNNCKINITVTSTADIHGIYYGNGSLVTKKKSNLLLSTTESIYYIQLKSDKEITTYNIHLQCNKQCVTKTRRLLLDDTSSSAKLIIGPQGGPGPIGPTGPTG
eukprot:552644_1